MKKIQLTALTLTLNFQDLWVGIYWKKAWSHYTDDRQLTIYICVVPALPIMIQFEYTDKRVPWVLLHSLRPFKIGVDRVPW